MNPAATATGSPPAGVEPSTSTSRLMSLDVFRGATIAAMMVVNNPGDWSNTYQPLLHATWHGWTFTDLVFPFFIWIVGVAIPLSTARRLEQGQRRRDLFGHALRRALIIFGLGMLLNSFSYFASGSIFNEGGLTAYLNEVRIPGVLQRIAICYLAAVLVFLLTSIRGQVITVVGLLVSYWLLMMLVPVPGHGAGVLTKEGNFSGYIDGLVLGNHVWKSSRPWDPEGIVSTLPAIATCLFGILTGHVLRSRLIPEAKTAWIFTAGCLLLFAGQFMGIWLPINKPIWTSSYSIFMAGMAMVCFGVCYWLVDVQRWQKWAKPFAIYGMNAITVYVLAGLIARLFIEIKLPGPTGEPVGLKTWIYTHTLAHLPDPRIGSLLWALAFMALLYLVAWFMYRRKWFVRF